MKDLVDLVLIAETSAIPARELQAAVRTTFDARATHAVPEALPAPPSEWQTRYRTLATGFGIPADLDRGYRTAAAFLGPILAGSAAEAARWDPNSRAWRA